MFVQEVKDHLEHKIIPFWENLKDEEALARIRKEVACGDEVYGEPAKGH